MRSDPHSIDAARLRPAARADENHTGQALPELEARFRILPDAVPHIIWANAADGLATYFNRRWYEYTGLSYEESAGPGWQVVVHPDDAPASVLRWQNALASGEVFDTEYRLRRHDGAYRWHIGRNVPLKDEHERVTGWFGSATDIEELKQAEQARRESDERFRLLVDGAKDYAMFLLNLDARITFWSAGAERIFGWTSEEVLGQPGEIIFTPEDRAAGGPEQEIRTALAEGRAMDRRWHMVKTGQRIWCDGVLARLDASPLTSHFSGSSSPRGFAKIMRDATQERRAEDKIREAKEALERANEALEVRVAERTRELTAMATTRQHLLQQVVAAQEQERARISRELHDQMGQHLTGFLLGLDALRAGLPGGSELAALAERLGHAAAELSQEVHRMAWDLRPASLDDLGLAATLSSYVREWGERHGIAVDLHATNVDGEQRLPTELETALYRIVQEALNNVARHAEGATRVSIVLERRGDNAHLVVEDNGAGFDVASTLEDSNRLGIRGMRERAALQGGALEIESASGEGATLFVRVPVRSTPSRREFTG